MTRDDIIRMAREAGFSEWAVQTPQDLERFAVLIAAASERKPLPDAEIDHLAQLDGVTAYKAPDWFVELARAIERAHGIGETK